MLSFISHLQKGSDIFLLYVEHSEHRFQVFI